MEPNKILNSAFSFKSEDEKIKEVFFGGEDDKKEQPPEPAPGKEPEKKADPEKGEEKPPLSTYMTAAEVQKAIDDGMKEKLAPLQDAEHNRKVNEAMTEANKLKLAYETAKDDGEMEKAEEIFEQLIEARQKLKNLQAPNKEEKADKPKTLKEGLSDDEKVYIDVMMNDLRKEMFEGEEGKAREVKLATLHSKLLHTVPDPAKRLKFMQEAFDREWSSFTPDKPSTGGDPGDHDRGNAKPELTIDQIPHEYKEIARKQFKFSDEEILRVYKDDLATNFGLRRE